MRARRIRVFLAAVVALAGATPVVAQEVVDRIVARVENDIILLSQLRELGRYQQFVEGKSESDAQLLERLIDQWIVRNEADASHFPQPKDADIEHALDGLKKSFGSPEKFEAGKKESGYSDAEIRSTLAAQVYLTNYLDSRFRPSAQIEPRALEDYYQNTVIPRAQARGQSAPSFADAREYIQEFLVQRAINEQADLWLKESRARLHVEKHLGEGAP